MPDDRSADKTQRSHRWHAVECNNLAWQLSELPARTPAQDEEMLHAAHASAFHWARAGAEINRARACMLLGHVHATLGDGPLALRYARESYDYFAAGGAADWEIAFAHSTLAYAARAAGEHALYAAHYAQAEQLGRAIADAEDRQFFENTFRLIPRPSAET